MDVDMGRVLKANLIAGVLPGIISPLLWPIVVFLVEGKFPDWVNYPIAAVSIMFFATIIGLAGGVLIGFPTLLLLEKAQLNKPVAAALIALLLVLAGYWVLGPSLAEAPFSQSWPVSLFLGLLGAICALVASRLSRPNQALETDADFAPKKSSRHAARRSGRIRS